MVQAVAKFVVAGIHPVVVAAAMFAWLTPPSLCLAQTWTDVRELKPFLCRADFPMQGLESLLAELASLQNDLATQLGVHPPAEPIELYLFRDETSYRRYLRHYLPNEPYRPALYCKWDGPGKVLAYCGPNFQIDIRHECTHALLHATLPMVPLWLDEGLAEYFEATAEQRPYGNPHLEGVKWSVWFGQVASLERLEKEGDFSKLDGKDYRDSWAWVHFMLHGPPEAHDELVRFLADIQASTPPGALSKRLAGRLPNVKAQFAQHFKHWRRPTGPVAKRGVLDTLGDLAK
jgi:hypothetical protein